MTTKKSKRKHVCAATRRMDGWDAVFAMISALPQPLEYHVTTDPQTGHTIRVAKPLTFKAFA